MIAPSRRTALYRLFDSSGNLLYVGIGFSTSARWRAHAETKPWWPLVTRRDVTWFERREDAEVAEENAIRDEGPLFNVKTDRQRYRSARSVPSSALAHVAEASAEYRHTTSVLMEARNCLSDQVRMAHRDGLSQSAILKASNHVWSREYLRVVLGLTKKRGGGSGATE